MKRYFIYLLMALLSFPFGVQAQKQLTNLPTVYISTTNSAEVTSKKTFISATWTLVDGDKTENITGLKIRCRGNSTFSGAGATKKAYRLKFNKSVSLLGDKGVSDMNWVLMANHYDKSLIRNALTTDILGRFAGMEFNPGARFVDVVLNGTYIGNYQITDHPDVESGRLDIETPGELAEGEEPSEGFFLEADGWKDHKYVTTSLKSVPVRIHKPKDGEVTTAQADYVKSWLDHFEAALFGKDFKDADKGYRKLVDSVSLANLYVCTEICANYDGFWSTYLYKRPNDQKMYFGPLWDYDIAYSNDSRWGDSSRKMVVDLNSGVCRSWFTRMWRDPWFRQLILRRYHELRAAGIEAHLQYAVDSLATLNAQSAELNFQKYGINTKVYNENVLHNTYAEYITDLKDFLTKHFAYLDDELPMRAAATYEDDAHEFELSVNNYYRIQSVGVKTLFDVTNEGLTEGSLAYLWPKDTTRWTQQWAIRQVGEAYQFINRASGLALNAPNGELNTQLNLVQPNAGDEAQLWNIVLASDEASYYNIINKKYTRTANVSGGSADAGTKLICWESNEKNTTSLNRQWIIAPADFNSDEVWNIGDIYDVLNTEIAKYEALMAAETPGSAPGQVSQVSLNKLASVISEAKSVIKQERLNVNLTHTYIYYMERAWKVVEDSRIIVDPINFDAEGNYHLFQTPEGASYPTTDLRDINNDTPWGFYRYNVGDGIYEKFSTYDTDGSNGSATERGTAWYKEKEYCFVSSTGHYHATVDHSPAIVFTAPADGIYFATITVFRDKSNQSNTLYLRSRCLEEGESLQCDKNSYIFSKAYGTVALDGADGKVPQTLDFYIRMKAGQRFTFETEAYTAGKNDGGRTHIADLAVASCRNADVPFTLDEAKAYERFYDAVANAPINFDAEGNYHLFQMLDGADRATAAASFSQNNDSPWGFYRYTTDDGIYTKFTTFDAENSKAKTANGNSWYSDVEYVFVSENGNSHALPAASPAVMFTAPADGIYFATATIHRDKGGVSTPLYLRSRYIDGQEKQCSKEDFIFAKGYGTPDFDEENGLGRQTLNFFIRMKQGASFTFEIENYTANTDASGRSYFTDLAVASCRDTDKPFTLDDAKAYDRFYDAMAQEETPINFDAESNYHLFQTLEGADKATSAPDFAENNDTPWGFYRYSPADGSYTKFTKFDANSSKAKPANGKAWYTSDEYCFISENGNIHPLASNGNLASPAIAFTAPADGIYFATMTISRDKSAQTNPVNMRCRAVNNKLKCDKDNFMFEKAYGTAELDGADGKVPQTLDFFIKLKQGQTFTFEIDANNDSGARSFIADLAVASCRDKDKPFTEEEALAYERYFDADEAIVNEYTLTYTVDQEVYKTAEYPFGAVVTPEDTPEKEGHTFTGWSEIPETMPDHDVVVTGAFTVNQYTVKFLLDGEAIYEQKQDYGSTIVAPEVPEREGYSFSGWGEILETVPARDVVFTGAYMVNKYKVRYYVGEQLIAEDEIDFGAELKLRDYTPEDANRYSFEGWEGEGYTTMPAHDIEYHAIIADGMAQLNAGHDVKAIYDASGRKRSRLHKGVNVLIMKDGTTTKLFR